MQVAGSGVPGSGWDAELKLAGGHFLQSTAWLEVQQALGYQVLWARDEAFSWAGAVGGRAGLGYLYLPHGPTVQAGGLRASLASVASAARDSGLAFVRFEPTGSLGTGELPGCGARAARAVQPRHTWVLDLEADEATLRSQLSAGHRGSVNAAPRRGLSFRPSRDPGDIDTFLALIRRTGRGAFRPQSDRYYRTMLEVLLPRGAASLHLADHEGRTVAAAVGFDFGATRYYAHAAADPESRRLGAAAPLVWDMILESRAAGQRCFDFWGVLPQSDPDHPWSGLSQFKRSFGGRLVERPGTWELPLRRWRYLAHAVLSRRRRAGRR